MLYNILKKKRINVARIVENILSVTYNIHSFILIMSEKRGIDDMDVRDCMYISNGLKIQNGGKIILD